MSARKKILISLCVIAYAALASYGIKSSLEDIAEENNFHEGTQK